MDGLHVVPDDEVIQVFMPEPVQLSNFGKPIKKPTTELDNLTEFLLEFYFNEIQRSATSALNSKQQKQTMFLYFKVCLKQFDIIKFADKCPNVANELLNQESSESIRKAVFKILDEFYPNELILIELINVMVELETCLLKPRFELLDTEALCSITGWITEMSETEYSIQSRIHKCQNPHCADPNYIQIQYSTCGIIVTKRDSKHKLIKPAKKHQLLAVDLRCNECIGQMQELPSESVSQGYRFAKLSTKFTLNANYKLLMTLEMSSGIEGKNVRVIGRYTRFYPDSLNKDYGFGFRVNSISPIHHSFNEGKDCFDYSYDKVGLVSSLDNVSPANFANHLMPEEMYSRLKQSLLTSLVSISNSVKIKPIHCLIVTHGWNPVVNRLLKYASNLKNYNYHASLDNCNSFTALDYYNEFNTRSKINSIIVLEQMAKLTRKQAEKLSEFLSSSPNALWAVLEVDEKFKFPLMDTSNLMMRSVYSKFNIVLNLCNSRNNLDHEQLLAEHLFSSNTASTTIGRISRVNNTIIQSQECQDLLQLYFIKLRKIKETGFITLLNLIQLANANATLNFRSIATREDALSAILSIEETLPLLKGPGLLRFEPLNQDRENWRLAYSSLEQVLDAIQSI